MHPESSWARQLDDSAIGEDVFALAAEIYPICRSITGNGVRETLALLARHIEISVHEVPTGAQVFDWTIPREWNIRDAYIKNARGVKLVDFFQSNLHVMGYSVPVQKRVPLSELKTHIYTLPEQPNLIPYRTSYYSENWGFCMAHRQFASLSDETYEVVIDFEPRRRISHLRRIPAQRRDRRRMSAFGPYLPPLARQRQLLGACAAYPSCEKAFAHKDAL